MFCSLFLQKSCLHPNRWFSMTSSFHTQGTFQRAITSPDEGCSADTLVSVPHWYCIPFFNLRCLVVEDPTVFWLVRVSFFVFPESWILLFWLFPPRHFANFAMCPRDREKLRNGSNEKEKYPSRLVTTQKPQSSTHHLVIQIIQVEKR